MSTAVLTGPSHRRAWGAAQLGGVALLVALVTGLLVAPDPTLNLLWNAAIPVLPAVFLVNATIWRNACPLATLSLWPDPLRGRAIDGAVVRATAIGGIGLFLLLVPARRFLFNTNGLALAAVIVVVGLIALAAGFAFQRKASFCNTICPVHPIERLYGQQPLLPVMNVRCPSCIGCTSHGCLDRSPAESLDTVLGAGTSRRWWIVSPFGLFAAALPGFIVAFYTLGNVTPGQALEVYRSIAIAMLASAGVVVLTIGALRIRPGLVMPLLAAAASGLYYWFAAPAIVAAWQLSPIVGWLIRTVALVLVAAWLMKSLRTRVPNDGPVGA